MLAALAALALVIAGLAPTSAVAYDYAPHDYDAVGEVAHCKQLVVARAADSTRLVRSTIAGLQEELDASTLCRRGVTRSIDDLPTLRGATPSEVDDLARQAGFTVKPGTKQNPSTTYFRPGTNQSVGFRVVPQGIAGQPGVKAGPYLRRFGSPVDEPLRIPLAGNPEP